MGEKRHLICNLASIMAERNIKTLSKLSEISGLSRMAVDRCYYNKSKRLDFDTAIKLCKALKCELDELYTLVSEEEHQQIQKDEQSRNEKLKKGYVYFIRNPHTELIKIGKTRDVEVRLNQLSYEFKQRLELIGAIPYEDSAKAERKLHVMFGDCRKTGEWFDIKIEDVAEILEKELV